MYIFMSLSRGLPVTALLQGGTIKKTIDYTETGRHRFLHYYQVMLWKGMKHDENIHSAVEGELSQDGEEFPPEASGCAYRDSSTSRFVASEPPPSVYRGGWRSMT